MNALNATPLKPSVGRNKLHIDIITQWQLSYFIRKIEIYVMHDTLTSADVALSKPNEANLWNGP
jgi:hypothetical protein